MKIKTPKSRKAKMTWPEQCRHEAHKQGWDLFLLDDGILQIAALDDPHGVAADWGDYKYTGPKWNGSDRDIKAVAFVEEQAKKGDALAKRALASLRQHISTKCRVFIIGPSGHGESVGDRLHIVAQTGFKKGSLTDIYDTDDYREIDRTQSLRDARKIAAKYGQGKCPVI